jgi:DNA ligase-associated metallophosphoesterase
MDQVIEVAGERLTLAPERAVVWQSAGAAFVADLHWGKSSAFRAAGLPLGDDPTAHDLARLSGLLSRSSARELFLLGDLFHARAGKSRDVLDAARRWRDRHRDLAVTLIRGNHDRAAGDPPENLDIRVVAEPYLIGPFALRHHPAPTPGRYTFAGHIHPAVRLAGPGRQRLTLPCFHFTAGVGRLPAFGRFTGSAVVAPRPGDRVFAVAGSDVVEVGVPS